MEYLVTWYEGDEVFYRFVPAKEIDHELVDDRNLIITKLSPEEDTQLKH